MSAKPVILEAHEAANIFPRLSEAELEDLAKDILARGQLVPITLFEGKILDGRNRYEACGIAGVEPRYVEWDGRGYDGDPFAYTWAVNGLRRQIPADQRAALRLKVEEASEEWRAAREERKRKANEARAKGLKQGDRQPEAAASPSGATLHPTGDATEVQVLPPKKAPKPAKEKDALAASSGCSPRTAQTIISIKKKDPKLFEEVASGKKSGKQAEREIKQREIKEKAEAAKESTPVIPRVYTSMQELTWAVSGGDEQPFACIYADPPWPYENQGTRGATDNEYVTMSMEDIYALPVGDIAANDSLLFLWATSTLLPEAFVCMARWGFAYKSHLVWDKSPRFGLGNYFRICTEFLLVGTRGKPTWLRKDVPSIYRGEAAEHSKKPDGLRDLVESCAIGPHVELFARVAAPRWASMGNEVVAALGKEEAQR